MSSAPGPEKTSAAGVEPTVRSTSKGFDFSSFPGRLGVRLIARHARFYRRLWLVIASGAAEPLFYLLSVGIGIGGLIGTVQGPAGHPVPYRDFVAPGLLAVSALNGALNDSTFNVYGRLKFEKLYDSVLATPLGAQDFEYVVLVSVPLFLFSGTFFPLSVYPHVIGLIVEWTPLYQGVVILRDLVLGAP